jgi:hypothetical protein
MGTLIATACALPGQQGCKRASAHRIERIVVESFSLRLPRWLALITTRNPLIRHSDRLEALVILVAVAISMLTMPAAASVATELYYTHHALYVEQERSRHPVPSAATEAAPAAIGYVDPNVGAAQLLQAETPNRASETLWIDNSGKPVAAPTPPSQAVFEAAGVAVAIEVLVVGVMATLVGATRWYLGRNRDAHWNSILGAVLDDQDGHSPGRRQQ